MCMWISLLSEVTDIPHHPQQRCFRRLISYIEHNLHILWKISLTSRTPDLMKNNYMVLNTLYFRSISPDCGTNQSTRTSASTRRTCKRCTERTQSHGWIWDFLRDQWETADIERKALHHQKKQTWIFALGLSNEEIHFKCENGCLLLKKKFTKGKKGIRVVRVVTLDLWKSLWQNQPVSAVFRAKLACLFLHSS